MDELIKAMSDSDLMELKGKYVDNSSVVTLIDGILETRGKEAEAIKVKVDFERGIAKLLAKLPHPDDVHNIYVRWGEVDVADGELEEVVFDSKGVVIPMTLLIEDMTPEQLDELGSYTYETRQPSHKEFQWIVEVNHATKVTGNSTTGVTTASKRAITVYKRNGTQLELKGHYASASKACEALGLIIGGDSAIRVLARDNYITESYEGVDYSS